MISYYRWDAMQRIYPHSVLDSALEPHISYNGLPGIAANAAAGETIPFCIALRSDKEINNFWVAESSPFIPPSIAVPLKATIEPRIAYYQRFVGSKAGGTMLELSEDASDGSDTMQIGLSGNKLTFSQYKPAETGVNRLSNANTQHITHSGTILVIFKPTSSGSEQTVWIQPDGSTAYQKVSTSGSRTFTFNKAFSGPNFAGKITSAELLTDLVAGTDFNALVSDLQTGTPMANFSTVGNYVPLRAPGADASTPLDVPLNNLQVSNNEETVIKLTFERNPGQAHAFALLTPGEFDLPEVRNATIPANEATLIWVDVSIDEAARAGVYSARIKITGDHGTGEEFEQEIMLRLFVTSFRLLPPKICAPLATCPACTFRATTTSGMARLIPTSMKPTWIVNLAWCTGTGCGLPAPPACP